MLSGGPVAETASCLFGHLLREKRYAGPISVVPHGVDDEPGSRDAGLRIRHELGVQGIVIGYVGRFAQEKGIDDLLSAVELLVQGSPGRFCCLLIGGGPEEQRIHQRISNAKLDGIVTVIPAVPHNRMSEYYSALDVVVVPSRTVPRWKEQQGRVIVEAMAAGVPIVGSDSGAIPETVGDGGLIFREGDVLGLSSVLADLVRDDALRRDLGARGRARTQAYYANREVANQLAQALRAAAAAPR